MTADDFMAKVKHVPVVSGALIADADRYLLLRHKTEDADGLWGWPAGFVETGETLEAAAVREAKEETGLDVRILSELGVYHANANDVVKHLFLAEPIGGTVQADGTEIGEAQWLAEPEILALDDAGLLRAEWILDGVRAHKQLVEKRFS